MALTFDANYYLTQRPDVFQAFVATAGSTGLTWAQFAQQHYNNHGRFEGSNPNAVFNTDEYLAANVDVAAAGVNPFEHYLTHGVYEGRAPSASFPKLGAEFDAAAYLAANSDLAGAGIDTPEEAYAHFVLHGQFENRPGAPAVDSGIPGKLYTLTTGADTGAAFTGTDGNDTFEAGVVMAADGVTLVNTLQSIDHLKGGAGVDKLNATLNGGSATPVLDGIEIVNLRATAGSELNLSASTGVTNVNVQNSTAVATLTSIGNAAVGVSNQNSNVNINGSTATTLALNLEKVGTSTTPITIDLGSATANAATSFKITAKDANVTFSETTAGAATTSATVDASGANKLTFAGADLGSIATLEVTGLGSVDFSGGALTALKTLKAGDGGVTVDASGGVLETATTGSGKDSITAAGANVKNISTGAGNDTVRAVTSALAATAVVDLGAGDDTLNVGAAFAKNVTLTGGDGVDTLEMAKATYAAVSAYTTAELSKVTGFEVLSLTDALVTADSIDVSKISGVTSFKAADGVTNGNTAAVTNLGANSTVELAGAGANDGTLTLGLKTDTSDDALTVILNKNFVDNNNTTVENSSYSHAVVAATVENLTVNSTAKQTATFTPVEGYKADTVTNTLNLTGSNALVKLTITGDQKLIVATTAAMDKLTTIDASANTAGVEVNASASTVALTISGTAKADVIAGGAKGDTINLNGGNDIVDYSVAGSVSKIGTGAFDVINGFIANTKANSDVTPTQASATQSDWTGSVLRFDSGTGAAGVKLDIFTNAADATTFLANNASVTNGITAAFDATNNNLYVDNTGDGVADYFIKLTGVTTLTEAAFVVV